MSEKVTIEAHDLAVLADEVLSYLTVSSVDFEDRGEVWNIANITRALIAADDALGKTILKERES